MFSFYASESHSWSNFLYVSRVVWRKLEPDVGYIHQQFQHLGNGRRADPSRDDSDAAVGITVSWAQGDEKLLTAFIHNLQRITLPVVGTLYCSLLYLQGYEHSRHSGNTCRMDEVILFNSLPLHWEEKHKLLSMPWIIWFLPTSPNSNPDTHSYIHWTTMAPAT